MNHAGEENKASLPAILVPKEAKVEEYDLTDLDQQLHLHITHNDLPAVKSFLNQHKGEFDINNTVHGLTSLCLAVKLGHKSICDCLLSQDGIDVNKVTAQAETAVLLAIKNRDKCILRTLLETGANPDLPEPHGDIATPLYNAVWKGQRDLVAMLIDSGCDLNKGSTRLYSPLMMAARTGNMEVARMLTKAACDVNVQNKFGVTPLYEAVLRGNPKMVEFLIHAGSNVDIPDEYGVTPLYLAVKSRDPSIVELLLQGEADIMKQSHGETPTTAAAFNDRHRSLQMLLERGSQLGLIPHRPDILASTMMKSGCRYSNSLEDNPQVETADILIRAHSVHKLPLEPEILSTMRAFSHLAVMVILAGIVKPSQIPDNTDLACREHKVFLQEARTGPLLLKDLSRILIRLQLGAHNLGTVPQLPVPKSVKEFLLFADSNPLYQLPRWDPDPAQEAALLKEALSRMQQR